MDFSILFHSNSRGVIKYNYMFHSNPDAESIFVFKFCIFLIPLFIPTMNSLFLYCF